jgi:serine/threonine-protein kinase
MPPSSLPPSIGRYRVERLIGRGAMGVVYQAHDPVIDRRVAIKLVLADLLAAEERDDFLERFRREAQAAGRCVHTNIVTVFDFALHDGSPYLAMEFVEGSSLVRSPKAGNAMPPAQAGAIVQQILAGLQAAHAQGVVHRDIKPANVLLTAQGHVKITDFGVARLARSGLTQDGAIVGTLSYMSPEQCRGQAVDQRADLFSTACILHELLFSARPFPGQHEAEVMQRLLNEAPFVPPSHQVPPALLQVVQQGLAKNPDERFASAAAMEAALRAALAEPGAPMESDNTVVQIAPRPPEPAPQPAFDAATLADIERQLAAYLGPIARAVVQSAARRAPSLEALREMVASNIEKPLDRDLFLRGPTKSGVTQASSTAAPALVAAVLEAAQKELARFIGPIASVIVRRAAPKAASASALWDMLAKHIEKPADRAEFLKRRP